MAKGFRQLRAHGFVLMAVSAALCAAAEPNAVPKGLEGVWDSAAYISIDEVRPGMEAYTLTVYKGVEAEKFGLEVVSVVRDFMPGKDAILVRGTDERFIHTGPVAGCSGSPVYINGRLAGALAFGWIFSKDPLYGVTPIADMLRVGQLEDGGRKTEDRRQKTEDGPGLLLDFSKPLDFSEVEKKLLTTFASAGRTPSGATTLPSPLVVSGLQEQVKADLDNVLGPLGFMAVSGGGAGADTCDIKLAAGACLAVPLVDGDMTIDVIGTVTDVRGDEVYGFGHSFLGYGAVDLPMATGQVHTVMSSMMRSFKVAAASRIVGALRIDESTAVRGKLGAEASMIPLKIIINRYNDREPRRFNCRVADNRLLTPLLLRYSIANLVYLRGNLPPDNTIRYKGTIEMDDAQSVVYENVSTGMELTEMIRDSISPVALLMNNPYSRVKIKSLEFEADVSEKNITAAIWSVEMSQSTLKPGERLDVDVVIERFQAQKQKYSFSFAIPDKTPDGTYQLIVCGGYDYGEFLRKSSPHRFTPEDLDTLVGAINDILAIGRDELHCILTLQPGTVVLEKAELPELPATKALVLGDAKRAIKMQMVPSYIDEKVRTGAIVIDSRVMNVKVEE
jgi:hypothetical protein